MIIYYKTEKVQINNRKENRKQTTGNLKQKNDRMCAHISDQLEYSYLTLWESRKIGRNLKKEIQQWMYRINQRAIWFTFHDKSTQIQSEIQYVPSTSVSYALIFSELLFSPIESGLYSLFRKAILNETIVRSRYSFLRKKENVYSYLSNQAVYSFRKSHHFVYV